MITRLTSSPSYTLYQRLPRVGPSGPLPPIPTLGNIFVSPIGNDFNNGSELHPFRTINKAASVVVPDDVVVVEDGIWIDAHTGFSSQPSIVEVARGGVNGHPVTFRARNYLGAKLDGGGAGAVDQGFNFRSGAGWINIVGFEIYNMASTTGSCAGIDMFGGGHDSIVSQCYIRHCGRICITHGFGQNGIYIGAINVTVERTKITDIGRLGPTEGCATPGPYQSNDHGIYHADGDNFTLRDCLLWSNVHGWSLQEYPSPRDGLRVLNNTFAFGNPFFNFTHIVLDGKFTNALLANNIFYDVSPSSTLKVTSFDPTGDMTLRKNITKGTAWTDVITPPQINILPGNQLNTNALLVNPPTDFRCQLGSPAIDAGDFFADVLYDFDGVARPQGAAYDIGAYER